MYGYKLLFLIVAVCGELTSAVVSEKRAATANCVAFDEYQLDASKCTDQMQQRDSTFQDLKTLLMDAQHESDRLDFISCVLEISYRYIHCASYVETVSALYFNVTKSQLPLPSSEWWNLSAKYDSSHNRSANRLVAADEALLVRQLSSISQDSHPGCVQWLIDHFQGVARQWWRSQYPQFPDPRRYASTSTTHITTTTSPSTTTTTPTMTTTTTRQTSMVTTTQASTSAGVSCTVCQDLDCLLAPQVNRCPPHNNNCIITVADSGRSRSITRGCADQATCDRMRQNPAHCAQVESGYHPGTVCIFCCSTDNCNIPPALVPRS